MRELRKWNSSKQVFYLIEDIVSSCDLPRDFGSNALTQLHQARAYPGELAELLVSGSCALAATLQELKRLELVVQTSSQGTQQGWRLSPSGVSALQPAWRLGAVGPALVCRDVALLECTVWELMHHLQNNNWQHQVWSPRKRGSTGPRRPPAYVPGDDTPSNKTWYTLCSARTVSWNYLLTLCMLTRGELIMAQPVEHLKAAGHYLRMRQSRSTPVAVDDDLLLNMSCVSTEAEGITDMTTTSKPLRPSRSRGASGTKTKIELVPGESSDLEDPELLFHELENAEPPESPTAGGDAPVQPGSFSVAGGSASASTGGYAHTAFEGLVYRFCAPQIETRSSATLAIFENGRPKSAYRCSVGAVLGRL